MSRTAFVATLVMLLVACGGGGSSTSIPAPSALSYTNPVEDTKSTAMTPLSPTVTGTVASYSVSPALPAGVSLSTTSGVISGTPTATSARATYTITATNATGTTTFAWVLTVQAVVASQTAIFSDAPVAGLSYTASPSGATGTTNALGEFNYAPGDSVTFSAAGITLGTATDLSATSTNGNPSVVTAINLVPSATSATNPTVTAIGQLLGALNSVAAAVGENNGGTFVIPTATGLSGTPATTVTTLLDTLKDSGITTGTLATAVGSGGMVHTAVVSAGGTVPTAANAQANITQSVNAAGFIGTLWTAPCAACNDGAGETVTLIFNPDGVVRGFGTIDSDSKGTLIGTWQASTSSTGGASFTVVSTPNTNNNGADTLDGSYLQGTLSATAGTAQIYSSSGTVQGPSLAFAESPLPADTNTTYLGAWKISVVVSSAGDISGAGQSIFAIFEPSGNWYLSVAKAASVGTWDLGTGVGTLAITSNNPTSTCEATTSNPQTLSVNLAAGTATLADSGSGTVTGSGTITRSGLGSAEILDGFSDNAGTLAEAALEVNIPLSLNVNVSWPANIIGGSATSSLVLGVALTGPGNVGTACNVGNAAKLEAYGLRPEINSLGNGAAAGSTPDTITFGYIKTQAASYQVSVLGPHAQYCSVTQNGSGPIVDADSGNASAYPTVEVVCSQ
jgi:hypothetical protein